MLTMSRFACQLEEAKEIAALGYEKLTSDPSQQLHEVMLQYSTTLLLLLCSLLTL